MAGVRILFREFTTNGHGRRLHVSLILSWTFESALLSVDGPSLDVGLVVVWACACRDMQTAVVRNARCSQPRHRQSMALTTFITTQGCRRMSSNESAAIEAPLPSSSTRPKAHLAAVKTFQPTKLRTGQEVMIFKGAYLRLRKPGTDASSEVLVPAVHWPPNYPPKPNPDQPKTLEPVFSGTLGQRKSRFSTTDSTVVPEELERKPEEHLNGTVAAMAYLRAKGEKLDRPPATLFPTILLWLLRHSARDFGHQIVPDGFVKISELVSLP